MSTTRYKHDPSRSKAHIVLWQRPGEGNKGRRKQAFATEPEARAFQHAIDAELGDTRVVRLPAGAVTFQAFADDWRANIVARRKASTASSYEQLLRIHVYPHLGRVVLSDDSLGVDQVVRVLTKRKAAGVGWGTQKAILRVISSALSYARLTKRMKHNPCTGLIKVLRDDSGDDEYVDPEPNPLTHAHATAFLHWLLTGVGSKAGHVDGPRLRSSSKPGAVVNFRSHGYPEWHLYFLTLFRTGMRRGEAAALKWEDLDFDAQPAALAWLRRSYSPATARARTGHQQGDTTLKTKHAHHVELAPVVVDALQQLHAQRQRDALRTQRTLSPYVFLTLKGKRVLPDCAAAERVFEKGMAAIGLKLKGHTIHDTRDTFATTHLEAGAPLAWVSDMLGHKQRSTTLNRYTKWVKSSAGVSFAGLVDKRDDERDDAKRGAR